MDVRIRTPKLRPAIVALIAASATLSLTGCDQIDQIVKASVDRYLSKSEIETKSEYQKIREQIDELKSENIELKKKIATLELSNSINDHFLSTIEQKPASIVDGEGYGIARTPQGPVIVVMDKIQPYLDGYKVTLRIGNMTAATMNGIELEVEWGLPYGTKDIAFSKIEASRKKKTFSFTSRFPSGAYTLVDVILTPASPNEVKTLSVSPKWNILSLRMPPERAAP